MKTAKQSDSVTEDLTGKLQPGAKGRSAVSLGSPMLKDVKVTLNAKLGEVEMTVADLMSMQAGAVLKLGLRMNDLIELHLDDSLVARGEIVAVDDHFGVRIVEVSELA